MRYLINRCAFAIVLSVFALPVFTQVGVEGNVTNALREIEASWEKSPRMCYEKISRLCQTKPDDPALKILFSGLSKLPIPSAEENVEAMWDPLFYKWKILLKLADCPSLRNEPETWEGVASMVGWVRLQIIPKHQRQEPDKAGLFAKTEQERQKALHDYAQKIAMNNCQQEMASIVERWNSRSRLLINRIRRIASQMPPDERKQFLDKIKEMAGSDDEEAKFLDAPYDN
jgi:hypothetical protein